MTAHENVGIVALIFQVAAAGYALWLNYIFAKRPIAWAPRMALLLLVAMHLVEGWKPTVLTSTVGVTEWGYMFVSLFLLLGLSQLGRPLQKRRESLDLSGLHRDQIDPQQEEQTADLVRTNMQLAREMEQRKVIEGEIRASQELYQGLIDSLDGVVFECRSSDFGFTFVSPQSERLFGYDAEHWVRHLTWRDIIHREDYDRFSEALRKIPPIGERPSDWLEYRVMTRNGAVRSVSQFANAVTVKSGDIRIRGVLLDVTERKQFEDEVRQQQKLEAIGRLAGGIAHDFNNNLTVIQGYSQLLLSSKELVAEFADYLKRISQASDKAAQLTQQLLAFSRKQELKTGPVDVNTVVENISKMLRAIVGEAVTVNLNLAGDLPLVEADAGQLGQVLVSLVVNSRDAMPSGGRLVIQTEVVTFGANATETDPQVRPGTFVCLAVSDTGVGLSPGIRAHVFEPFFSTKDVGKGAGLGLSTVYGIVKQHHGWVRVSSETNQGTTFRLFFPTAQDQGRPETEKVKETSSPSNHETILLVDDEPALLDLVGSILQSHGYQVLSARSGLAALKLWNDQGKRVDLLLTDLVMPDGLSGLDLLGHLREDRPGLPAIVMSGYASPELSLSNRTAFIQKPYRPATLLKTIHDCLVNSGEVTAKMALERN